MPPAAKPPLTILLASPRGFCAGVDRAIQIVERALEKYGAPVYVRHEIVHNRFVVESLEAKGAVFVDELHEVPGDRPVVFSAHGVPKAVPQEAARRDLLFLDATCPLVSKVHREAERHHAMGRTVLLIGHRGHPEVIGTMGQLPEGAVILVEDVAQAERVAVPDPDTLAFATQTTLSVDDTAEIVAALQRRFPNLQGPKREDICYATTNRQAAVKAIAPRCDGLIVIGAPNSSNSMRLVEVAATYGCPKATLVQRAAELDWRWLEGVTRLGVTAGASAPEVLVDELIAACRARYAVAIEEVRVTDESTIFKLPRALVAYKSMAVYTEVADDQLDAFLADYDIGEPQSCKGIAEGVENSNYLLVTSRGTYILTLYEKRVDPRDLPFFLGLMDHLAARGIPCPTPVHGRDGGALRTLAGRPAAIITFLSGLWPRRIQVDHCGPVGEALARLHLAADGFALQRPNALSVAGWRPLFDGAKDRASEVMPGLADELGVDLAVLERDWPRELPAGVIHADLFPDNVFFLHEKLSGLIDFYFACNDLLAYDVAVCLNAWCFEADRSFNVTKARALIAGYQRARPLAAAERAALPLLARGAAMRFLLTRLYDWLHTPPGALVKRKDPLEYLAKLRFHRSVAGAGDYGL